MRTADYDFTLLADRIAQVPAERRDQSRLMVVSRATGTIEHRHFMDIGELIAPGDAVAINTTRVLRARLLGTRDSGGKAEVLLKSLGDDRFEALVHPGGKLKPGRVVHVAPELDVEILEVTDRRSRIVRLRSSLPVPDAIEPIRPCAAAALHRAQRQRSRRRAIPDGVRERAGISGRLHGRPSLHTRSARLAGRQRGDAESICCCTSARERSSRWKPTIRRTT